MPRPYRFGHTGARERSLGLDRENGPLTPTAVRLARPRDATEVARLRWAWSRIDRHPVTPSATALAETGAQLAGWLSALGSRDFCAVAVAGSRLIELLLASVDDRRVGFFMVHANDQALEFYRRIGFSGLPQFLPRET